MPSVRLLILVLLSCLSCVATTHTAHAQERGETTSQQRAAAQALFDEARKLMAQGRHAEACPKLEESQRLDPGVGTQFNLAACYEATGRTASAWSLFLDVASEAKRAAERARENVARERAHALEPKLSKLRLIVPDDARTVGLKIERANVAMGPAQWGAALPIDPGKHVVLVSAPGKRPAEFEVVVPSDGSTFTFTISPLRDAPKDATASSYEPGFFEALGTQRVVALSIGAAGVVALGVSGVFSVLALDAKSASEDNCDGNACNMQGLSDREDALAHGDIATVALVSGGVLLAAAAIVYATGAPDEQTPSTEQSPAAKLSPIFGPHVLGLNLRGSL